MLSRQFVSLSRTSYFNPAAVALATNVRFKSHAGGLLHKSDQAGDPLHQSLAQSKESKANPHKTTPSDAAASHARPAHQASRSDVSGNPENIGFADQVGSQSASADRDATSSADEGKAGNENVTPPSFLDAVKNKLGMKTTAGEDKQNRGGGAGVTGTGRSAERAFSTSAVSRADRTTQGQAPASSRAPQEPTHGEQNPHLKHKAASERDSGKGNAAEHPSLPSKQYNDKSNGTPKQSRSFSTSARVHAEKHTAETYFKDVDDSPASGKVHQVDSSSTGAAVQEANGPTTGEYSRSGVGSKEYETVSKGDPYDVPPSAGAEKDQKLRYGGEPANVESGKKDGASSPDEGPHGSAKEGRKPEGR